MENQEHKISSIDDLSNFIEDVNAAIIKVIGVGGGGGNAVNYMYNQDIPNVNFVVCNTDAQHLEMSPVPNKLILGFELTGGRGAGNEPEVGRQCALASEAEIRKLFDDTTEMVFITAGMGGGTGTGAAPVIAQIARESGMLTIGIVTVPFYFEGESKILKALKGANEMKKYVDALLVINNENLIELYKDFNIFNAFSKADETLANAARSISEIISEKCYINVDFQDVKTILKDSGTAIISTAVGEGEHRISNAIHNALHSPLLKKHDIKTSKRLLLKFSCNRNSENPVCAEEINEITQFTSKLPPSIDVKWGFADNPEMGDNVKVTILASGFDVTLRDDKEDKKIVIESFSEPITAQKSVQKADDEQIAEFYGAEKVTALRHNVAKIKYAVLKPSQFDDHEIIALLESTPSWNRSPRFNEELKRLSEPRRAESSDEKTNETGAAPISFNFDED